MTHWSKLEEGRPLVTCAAAICPRCGCTVVRRQPGTLIVGEATYHRSLADARAGAHPLRNCPKCGRQLPAAAGY